MSTETHFGEERPLGIVPPTTVGQRMRIAREYAGLETEAFAQDLGTTRQTVNANERGRTQPRELLLRAWSMRTGVSLHWLKTGEAPPPSGDGASVSSLLSESNRRPFHYRSDNRTRLASA